MDEKERRSAFLSALTTEHFVLQTAASATVSESAARASIYILSLSSTLVAMGFASQSREAFFIGVVTVAILVGVFYAYQRWRFGLAQRTAPPPDQTPATP